jgi:NADPH:quinone reductase
LKAIVCESWGGPSQLRWADVASKALTEGQIRIRVRASGVNFADALMVSGKYQVKPAFPFSPGLESAGEITELAPDVTHLRLGQRVLAVSRFGGAYSEELVSDARAVVPIPDTMDLVTAATFPVAYGTSYLALAHRGCLKANETLVVTGASGGVGLAAVEIGKKLGAKVIAIAGGADKCAVARERGADLTIDHQSQDIKNSIKSMTDGRGADVVYDAVGGDLFDACLHAVNWEARLLIIGFASGRIQSVPANLILLKNISVTGVVWGAHAARDPVFISSQLLELLQWYQRGQLKPLVARTFPMSQAAEALEALLSRKYSGKLALVT